jgi:DNA helicase II / ATP-dependent DNA helicase PcrA
VSFEVCAKRQAVIDDGGHVLVLGGPGAGKTTLALLKAKAVIPGLKPGQKILFLSFSRSAVHQILVRCKDVLQRLDRSAIDVRTYHAFCWDLLHCHGRALGGAPLQMMTPGEEGVSRTRFAGDWLEERLRLLDRESIVCFDLFAHAAARLIEESRHLREWIAKLFPLVILDEFQDTDDDQWRLAQALARVTQVAFLADGEQRIYDFRPGVRPDRIDILRTALSPRETDLQSDNHRSGGSQIIAYANAVLRGGGPLPSTRDVVVQKYRPLQNIFNATVHFAVGHTFGELRRRGVSNPTVAVFAPSNDLVADISDILSQQHGFGGHALAPIPHEVVWDAELSAAAALAVAATLEFASVPSTQRQQAMFLRLSQYWFAKKDWAEQHGGRGAHTANTRAIRFQDAVERTAANQPLRRGACQSLTSCATALHPLAGEPVNDWLRVRSLFRQHAELKDVFSQVRTVRLFRATDALANALAALWLARASYEGAVQAFRRILDQERLIGATREPQGCVLMTLHKSKGKEFDGTIIVEGFRGGALLKHSEAPHYEPSRRLLRVGITRARKLVVLVRPQGARPLTS